MNGEAATMERLNALRRFDLTREAVAAARALAARLNREIEQGNDVAAFTIALFIALAKDGLDWVLDFILIGEIPVVGQVPGIFATAFLYYFLWGKGWLLKWRIRAIFWIFGFFFDNLPLANNLPLSTLAVLWAWHNVRQRAAEAERELEGLQKKVGTALAEAET